MRFLQQLELLETEKDCRHPNLGFQISILMVFDSPMMKWIKNTLGMLVCLSIRCPLKPNQFKTQKTYLHALVRNQRALVQVPRVGHRSILTID